MAKMIYGQVNCPNCGRFKTVHLNKQDLRYDMRLACEHCGHNENATSWKSMVQNKGREMDYVK